MSHFPLLLPTSCRPPATLKVRGRLRVLALWLGSAAGASRGRS